MGRLSSIIKISLVSLAGFSLVSNVKTPAKEVQVVEAAESVSSYYSGISDSLTGTSLLTALRSLNSSKKTKNVTYGGFRQGAAYFDKDPDGSGKIIGFYNNAKVGPAWDGGNTWNREHVWPNSRGGSAVEDDAHMIRPTATSINSSRGNNVYGESGSGTYDPGQYYPAYRGIAARIVFYSMVATTGLVLNDSTANQNNNMGKLSELLKWNLEYQPATSTLELRTEQSRNNAIHAGNSYSQGNRNPFIDHPEYACKIWGDTNEATRTACSGQTIGGGSNTGGSGNDNTGDTGSDGPVTSGPGSLATPYTVSEAYAIASQLATGASNNQQVYIIGDVVAGVDTYNKATPNVYNKRVSFHISDGSKTLLAYNVNDKDGNASFESSPVVVGDKVIVTGALKNYNGTLEICYISGVADCNLVEINPEETGGNTGGNTAGDVVSKPTLNKTEITLQPGATYQLRVENAEGTVTWSSGNNRVATVDQNGKVTAGSMEGKTAIIAQVGGETLTCMVTVSGSAPELPPESSGSSSGGCGGSIIASSSILSISGFFLLALMIKRKRKLK